MLDIGGSGNEKVFEKSGIRVDHDENGNGKITLGTWMDFSFVGIYGLTGSGIAHMDHIDRKPIVSLAKETATATTLTVKASVTNSVSATKYKFICNRETKEVTTNKVTFENLKPSTRYTVKCSGYANGGYGDETSITITTDSQSTISEIGEFTLNGVKLKIEGKSGDKSTIKVVVSDQIIVIRENIGIGEYNLILTDEEKEKIYKLIGINDSINVTLRIETVGAGIDYNTDITLTGDVFSCTLTIDGINKKCKVWVGTASGNKQGIFTIGTNKGNVRGK